MKGWVYVASMSNTVGVLKIGHSTRDPDERVREWANDTGAPGTAPAIDRFRGAAGGSCA